MTARGSLKHSAVSFKHGPIVDDDSQSSSSDLISDSSHRYEKSIYDLPLIFHQDALESFNVSNRRRTTFMEWKKRENESRRKSSLVVGIERISKFSKLNTKIMHNILASKMSFEYIRNIAIEKLKNDTRKQLNIFQQYQFCSDSEESAADQIPYQVFSWEYDNFLERRKINNLVWVDILMRETEHDCLDALKFQLDIQELMKYLDIIIKSFLYDDPSYSVEDDIMATIQSIYDYLNIFETLVKECDENKTRFREDINKSLALRFYHRDAKTTQRRRSLEEQVMNMDVWDPIELRYQLQYYKAKVLQSSDKRGIELIKMEEKIKNYEKLILTDKYCSQCTLNALYTEIEDFKNRIDTFMTKFQIDEDKYENQIMAQRLAIEKLQNQQKYFTEEIARFYEEYELQRQKEIRNQLREQQLHQERLAREAEKKAAKAAKKLEKKRALLAARQAARKSIAERAGKKN